MHCSFKIQPPGYRRKCMCTDTGSIGGCLVLHCLYVHCVHCAVTIVAVIKTIYHLSSTVNTLNQHICIDLLKSISRMRSTSKIVLYGKKFNCNIMLTVQLELMSLYILLTEQTTRTLLPLYTLLTVQTTRTHIPLYTAYCADN